VGGLGGDAMEQMYGKTSPEARYPVFTSGRDLKKMSIIIKGYNEETPSEGMVQMRPARESVKSKEWFERRVLFNQKERSNCKRRG